MGQKPSISLVSDDICFRSLKIVFSENSSVQKEQMD
jgi:hypothetical protein